MFEICEVFKSICGEGSELGQIATFVRVARCSSHCNYCDTAYSLAPGQPCEAAALMEQINAYGCRRVFWTGGEPLLYAEDIQQMINRYMPRRDGWQHIIQTNGKHCGALTCDFIEQLAMVSVDHKGPSAGPTAEVPELELYRLMRRVASTRQVRMQVKYLVQDDEDYRFAKSKIAAYSDWRRGATAPSGEAGAPTAADLLGNRLEIIIGPVGGLDMRALAERVLSDDFLGTHPQVRVGCQVHKLLWGNKRGV